MAHYDKPDTETHTDIEVSTEIPRQQTSKVPEHIAERTENLLSTHPMTNQNIILDTAVWWFNHCGNCAIYKWIVHHLDALENDSSVRQQTDIFTDALEQAKELGIVEVEETSP